MKKEEICFIRPKLKNDYWYDAIERMGYSAVIPYKDFNLALRLLREAWFRLKLPKRRLWFNTEILNSQAEMFIVKDPLMTVEFLKWLRKEKPNARILLDYDNRVGMSINPDDVDDKSIEKWSYDADDCKKYSMKQKPVGYFDIYKIQRLQAPSYDIVYLGRDKGRAVQLFDLKDSFERMGLKTYFHICPTRSYMRLRHSYYKPIMAYTDYLELTSKTKAILNIIPRGQRSITQRELEAVFHSIKCITNNTGIKDFELYHPSRFFILGVDDMENLPGFLEIEFLKVPDEQLKNYKFTYVIEKMKRMKME